MTTLRNRNQQLRVDELAAFRPRKRPAGSSRRQTRRKEGYREFHPVSGTLVILGGGTLALFVTVFLTNYLLRSFRD